MGFRSLRVLNDDIIGPGTGFDTHPHRNMEIITYVISGSLAHRDSLGNGSVLRPGRVQAMSAGRGIAHSEFNASETEPVHLLQIWIQPAVPGLEAGYQEREFSEDERRDRWRVIASRDGRDGSAVIHQDAMCFAGILSAGKTLKYELKPGRNAWLQVARGKVEVNGQLLGGGDGVAVTGNESLTIHAGEEAEMLLFDLA